MLLAFLLSVLAVGPGQTTHEMLPVAARKNPHFFVLHFLHYFTALLNMAPPSVAAASPPQQVTKSHPLDAKLSYLSITYHDSLPFVTVVALNRPKKRNAINAQVCGMWG